MGLFVGTEKQLAASRKKQGRSKGGKSFDKAFATARKDPKAKSFVWKGKSYSTKLAGGGGGGGGAKAAVKSKLPNKAPVPASRPGKVSTTGGKVGNVPIPTRRPDAAVAAVKPVPTPAPGRTGEIYRIVERNRTNPPPANNKDVMKRVQDSIAAGKNKPAGPRPGSPTGPRGAQYRQGKGEIPKGYQANRFLPAGEGEPGNKRYPTVGQSKPQRVHPTREDYSVRRNPDVARTAADVMDTRKRMDLVTKSPSHRGTRITHASAKAQTYPMPARPGVVSAGKVTVKPSPGTPVKPGSSATVASNTFTKQQRLDAALQKAKQRSAQADARTRPTAAVAAVKTKPAPAKQLPSRGKPTYPGAVKKRVLGIRRGL